MFWKPKIYDCFPFFNEFDILEIRLNELADVVDHFVLVESTQTFRGLSKPLYFEQNKERFAAFLHKIIHVVVHDMPAGGEAEPDRWRRENFQRQLILRGLEDARWFDWIVVSDADEIPNRDALKSIVMRNSYAPTRYTLAMSIHFYLLDLKHKEQIWTHPRVARRIFLKDLNQFRLFGEPWITPRHQPKRLAKTIEYFRSPMRWKTVPDAGWHLTFMNGEQAIVEKLRHYPHVGRDEDNTTARARQTIEQALNSEQFELVNIDQLPHHVQQNAGKYAHLMAAAFRKDHIALAQ